MITPGLGLGLFLVFNQSSIVQDSSKIQGGGERSESARILVTYTSVKMNLYMWRQVMTHPCGTEFLSLRCWTLRMRSTESWVKTF